MTGTLHRPADGVRLSGLRKAYGSTVAVDGIDLTITGGEIVALLGPNGAGKSTTIDMLLGLTRPDEGSVTVFGRSPGDACARGQVGAMLQNGGLLAGVTVRELVKIIGALYPRARPLEEVLDAAGVADIVDARTDRLSGGQRQRLRFALALLPDPDLIVLDEPTAAMDVEARRAFWAAMRAWAADGRTVVFATHYLAEADDFADRIVLLRRGRVVADGPTTEVKGLVEGRTIRATLRGVDDAVVAGLRHLPGVRAAQVRGEAIELSCADSDRALRALLSGYPRVSDIEVTGAALEDAFLALTAPDGESAGSARPAGVPMNVPVGARTGARIGARIGAATRTALAGAPVPHPRQHGDEPEEFQA
jgi:ABC-2 type transport system ATP-binding protein